MTDVLATFFVVACLLLLLRATTQHSLGAFAAAGFAGGLAASTKYSAAAVGASMAAAQIVLVLGDSGAWRDIRRWLPMIAFAGAFAGGFLLGTPYALLDWQTFHGGLTYDFTHLAGGHNGRQVEVGWISHATRSLPAGLSWPLFISGLVGFVPLARRHGRAAAIVGAFCVALYASLGPGYTVFFRYILPLVPFLCLTAAFAVRWTRVPLLALVVAAPALWTSVWSDVMLARPDTRPEAARWLAEQVKPGESIYQAGSHYADVPLGPLLAQTWPRDAFDANAGAFADDALPEWVIIPESPLGLYTTVPPALRKVVSERYSTAHRVRAMFPGARDNGVYDEDDAFFLPVTGFSAVVRPGPTIIVYRRLGLR
jgi:hypothetical protein